MCIPMLMLPFCRFVQQDIMVLSLAICPPYTCRECLQPSFQLFSSFILQPPKCWQLNISNHYQLWLQILPTRPFEELAMFCLSKIKKVLPREMRVWRRGLCVRPLLPVSPQRGSWLHMFSACLGAVSGGELQGAVLQSDNTGGGGSLPAVSGGEHSLLLPRSLWSWVLVLRRSSSGQVETVC